MFKTNTADYEYLDSKLLKQVMYDAKSMKSLSLSFF